MKVELSWLLEKHAFLKFSKLQEGKRSHKFVQCLLCAEYESVAVENSKNGRCPLANGVRADDKERIKTVIDHLLSQSHAAVVKHKDLEEKYKKQSDKHPWLSLLKKQRAEKVDFLIKLCVDVYNDS
jgi:hypothetical protein